MARARPIALVVLVVLAIVSGVAGCRLRLVGLTDADLAYAAGGATPGSIDAIASHVDMRLLFARVPAEVRAGGGAGDVSIVADASEVEGVEHALAWRGGLSIYRFVDAPDLERGVDVEDPLRAAETKTDATRRLLYDPFARPARARGALREPVLDVPHALARADGKRIVIALTDKDARKLVEAAERLGDEKVAYAIGPRVIWIATLLAGLHPNTGEGTRAAIAIPRGTDLQAYARARHDARLLVSPPLPSLTRVADERRPPDYALAAATLLVPIVTGLGWLVFVRRFDRARPEPWRLVLATAALGALFAPLAGRVEGFLRDATPLFDTDVMILDRSALAFPVGLAVYTIAVGAVEEGAKLLAAWVFAFGRREHDEPIDGIVYAAAAAVGFAVEENIGYFARFRLEDGLVAARSLGCMADHLMFSAVWGYAFGRRLVSQKTRVLPWFLLAALLHGASDTMLAFAVPHASLVTRVGLTALFVVLVRRSLRRGSIRAGAPGEEAPPSEQRTLFRVGRPVAFGAAVVAMIGAAAVLGVIGSSADAEHVRVSVGILLRSAAPLAAFVVAAWGMAAAMPLDVAMDAHGVTFAGALVRWGDVRAVTRAARSVVVRADAGELRLGPAAEAKLDAIEAALRTQLDDPAVPVREGRGS